MSQMAKKDNEPKEKKWVSKGLGIFRLKKNKGDGKRRLLMRTEGAGNVILVRFSMMLFTCATVLPTTE